MRAWPYGRGAKVPVPPQTADYSSIGFSASFPSLAPVFLPTEGKMPAGRHRSRRQVGGDHNGGFLLLLPADLLQPYLRPLATSPTCPRQGLVLSPARTSTCLSTRAGVRPRRCPTACPENETVALTCRPACPPRHRILFYPLCGYIKSGIPPEDLSPLGPAHSPRAIIIIPV